MYLLPNMCIYLEFNNSYCKSLDIKQFWKFFFDQQEKK
jgi:hypothetical protein